MKANKKLINENFPLHIRIKKYKILCNFYFRAFWKKIFAIWPFTLFVISLVLFFLVLIPNSVLHKLPIISYWPRLLELHGTILIETKESYPNNLICVKSTSIEIGGYKSMTNPEGKFNIKFVSESFTNIPVIIQWSNNTVIKRVSFAANQFKKTHIFILNEK